MKASDSLQQHRRTRAEVGSQSSSRLPHPARSAGIAVALSGSLSDPSSKRQAITSVHYTSAELFDPSRWLDYPATSTQPPPRLHLSLKASYPTSPHHPPQRRVDRRAAQPASAAIPRRQHGPEQLPSFPTALIRVGGALQLAFKDLQKSSPSRAPLSRPIPCDAPRVRHQASSRALAVLE